MITCEMFVLYLKSAVECNLKLKKKSKILTAVFFRLVTIINPIACCMLTVYYQISVFVKKN